MAKTQTTAELRRALLHVIGAVHRLREIAGDFPLVDQDLRAAVDILVPPDASDGDQLIAAKVTPGEFVEVSADDRGAG